MKKFMLGATIAATAAATMAFADADSAIGARQTAMKAVGAAAKAQDFAAMNQAALAAQAAFNENTAGAGTLKTTAADNIWSDKAGFDAIMAQLISLSAAGDPAVFGTCKSCHKSYRNQ